MSTRPLPKVGGSPREAREAIAPSSREPHATRPPGARMTDPGSPRGRIASLEAQLEDARVSLARIEAERTSDADLMGKMLARVADVEIVMRKAQRELEAAQDRSRALERRDGESKSALDAAKERISALEKQLAETNIGIEQAQSALAAQRTEAAKRRSSSDVIRAHDAVVKLAHEQTVATIRAQYDLRIAELQTELDRTRNALEAHASRETGSSAPSAPGRRQLEAAEKTLAIAVRALAKAERREEESAHQRAAALAAARRLLEQTSAYVRACVGGEPPPGASADEHGPDVEITDEG